MVTCAAAFGQTGQITGRITTGDGAVMPGVSVVVTATGTGQQRVVKSNGAGYYTAPSLLPGAYFLTITSHGFRKIVRSGIQLQVEQTLQINFTLQPGSVNQTVVVSGQAPLLETETSSTGQVIGGRDVLKLPLLGRDAYALGELVPGVRGSIGMNNLPTDVISTSSISINGAQSSANDFLLDGAPNSAPSFNQPVIYPIADSVQEFKVLTNNFSAQYGRSAGGIYDVVTKSGTNSLHFTAYEFYRNAKLTANNWFAKAAGEAGPPLTFNQFGGVAGGPVILPKLYNGRNKTFFFVGAEFVRFDQGSTYTGTVPTAAELAGDFSGDRNSQGQPINIYNPFTTMGSSRQPFAGNLIPSNRLNPVALKMATYFPKPNTGGLAGSNVNNYVLAGEVQTHENAVTARIDHVFNPKTSMFLRYSYNNTPEDRPNPYGAGDAGGSAYGPQVFDRYNAILGADHAFSSSLLGSIRGSFARLTNQRDPVSLGFDVGSLGFPAQFAAQDSPDTFPAVIITGYGGSNSVANASPGYALGAAGQIAGYLNTFAIEATLTKTLGEHELVIGADLRLLQANILQAQDSSTNFSFTAAFTQGPNPSQSSATSGDALASFLLGTPSTGAVAPSPALAIETKYYAGFLEDNWRAADSLTLNLGIRYAFETPFTERFNRFSSFDPNANVPLTGLPGLHGALSFVGVDGNSRHDYDSEVDHVSPRLGFAWHPSRTTVVNGGGGIFYDTVWGANGEQPSNYGISGFTPTTAMVTSLDGVTPFDTLSNPYPSGLVPVTGSSLGSATLLGQSISAVQRNSLKTPYAIQWNLGIQQQLAVNWLLDIRYVGTHGVHEEAGLTLNQLPDADLARGSGLNTLVTNPFYGQIATGQLAQKTVSQAQLLRPYPQFTQVALADSSWAGSRYNALEVTLQKRLSHGFNFLGAYTWSKMIDQSSGPFSGESLGGGAIQDYNNLGAEVSVSQLDQTNRLVAGAVYQLPIVRSESGFAGHLLGGWTLSTITSFISGDPLGISSATNGTDSQGGGQRPDWNGQDPSLSHHTVAHWFNTADFSNPLAFHFGNTPRTFGNARGDWIRNIDLSLQKDTRLVRAATLQIRADAFNMDNTPTFAPPNTSYGSAQFGVVSAQQNTPRSIQLGVKVMY